MDDAATGNLTDDELTEFLKARIEALLRVVRLESAGRPIEPTSFRLTQGSSSCGD